MERPSSFRSGAPAVTLSTGPEEIFAGLHSGPRMPSMQCKSVKCSKALDYSRICVLDSLQVPCEQVRVASLLLSKGWKRGKRNQTLTYLLSDGISVALLPLRVVARLATCDWSATSSRLHVQEREVFIWRWQPRCANPSAGSPLSPSPPLA